MNRVFSMMLEMPPVLPDRRGASSMKRGLRFQPDTRRVSHAVGSPARLASSAKTGPIAPLVS